MLLPAEYRDAAARIRAGAVQHFGLFQFTARSKVSLIRRSPLPSCLPGSSKALCSRTLAIIFQRISSASNGAVCHFTARLKSSWSICER